MGVSTEGRGDGPSFEGRQAAESSTALNDSGRLALLSARRPLSFYHACLTVLDLEDRRCSLS